MYQLLIIQSSRMEIDVESGLWRRGIATGYAKGTVEGELVCDAKLKFVIPEIMELFRPKDVRSAGE